MSSSTRFHVLAVVLLIGCVSIAPSCTSITPSQNTHQSKPVTTGTVVRSGETERPKPVISAIACLRGATPGSVSMARYASPSDALVAEWVA